MHTKYSAVHGTVHCSFLWETTLKSLILSPNLVFYPIHLKFKVYGPCKGFQENHFSAWISSWIWSILSQAGPSVVFLEGELQPVRQCYVVWNGRPALFILYIVCNNGCHYCRPVLEVPTETPLQEDQVWSYLRDIVLGIEYCKSIFLVCSVLLRWVFMVNLPVRCISSGTKRFPTAPCMT